MNTDAQPAMHVAHGVRQGESEWWVSLDGQRWLGVDRRPGPDDYDDVVAIFAPTPRKDGGMFHRMTYARRWVLAPWGGNAALVE